MNWDQTKTHLLKGLVGLGVGAAGWMIVLFFRVSFDIRDAVHELKAVVEVIRADQVHSKEALKDHSAANDVRFTSLEHRVERLEERR